MEILLKRGEGKVRKSYGFTLIELLVVMLLMGLLMSLTLPAFNRMIRGNRVDQLASNLKLGLEQAQSHAVRTRRHVALVLPNDRERWTSSDSSEDKLLKQVWPFSHGGFRLAYVKKTTGSDSTAGSGSATESESKDSWEFVRWVQGQEWRNAPDGAMLVRVMGQSDADEDYNDYHEGAGIAEVATNMEKFEGGEDDKKNPFYSLANLENLKYGDDNSTSKKEVKHCLIVFSPYGGLESKQDLRLVIAEALPVGEKIAYPTQEAGGSENDPKPVNWKMLSINKFSGRVEYYPLPVSEEEKK